MGIRPLLLAQCYMGFWPILVLVLGGLDMCGNKSRACFVFIWVRLNRPNLLLLVLIVLGRSQNNNPRSSLSEVSAIAGVRVAENIFIGPNTWDFQIVGCSPDAVEVANSQGEGSICVRENSLHLFLDSQPFHSNLRRRPPSSAFRRSLVRLGKGAGRKSVNPAVNFRQYPFFFSRFICLGRKNRLHPPCHLVGPLGGSPDQLRLMRTSLWSLGYRLWGSEKPRRVSNFSSAAAVASCETNKEISGIPSVSVSLNASEQDLGSFVSEGTEKISGVAGKPGLAGSTAGLSDSDGSPGVQSLYTDSGNSSCSMHESSGVSVEWGGFGDGLAQRRSESIGESGSLPVVHVPLPDVHVHVHAPEEGAEHGSDVHSAHAKVGTTLSSGIAVDEGVQVSTELGNGVHVSTKMGDLVHGGGDLPRPSSPMVEVAQECWG
ncbi:hypothetical protein L1987_19165 [Smallanthus sonchifolius]|uniref:Uncharacterized protein n=1 Tax=Smallanthus sonchifolius TaxID=185202 RepID=A0ACB9J298_9ASTR|nr:hypothetical protein L1987_19165 [Smallanthus sonchifolius]